MTAQEIQRDLKHHGPQTLKILTLSYTAFCMLQYQEGAQSAPCYTKLSNKEVSKSLGLL